MNNTKRVRDGINASVSTFLLLLFFIFSQCGKDVYRVIPITEKEDTTTRFRVWVSEDFIHKNSPITQLFDTLHTLFSTKQINDISERKNILLGENANITLEKGAFRYQNGMVVSGNVEIEWSLLYAKGARIAQNKPTINESGHLLASVGDIQITARQNGELLQLDTALNSTFGYRLDERLGFLNRERIGLYSLRKVWTNPTKPNIDNRDSLTARLTELGWQGALYQRSDTLNLTNNINVKIDKDTLFTNQNTSVFLVSESQLTVIKLQGNPQNKTFTLPPTLKGLPLGEQNTLVALAYSEGQYYYQAYRFSIGENIPVISLEKSNLDEIKQKLANME